MPENRFHYAVRMFRATGERQYAVLLEDFFASQGASLFEKANALNSITDSPVIDEVFIRGPIRKNPVEYARILRRNEYYKLHPKLRLYFSAVEALYTLYSCSQFLTKSQRALLSSLIPKYQEFSWETELYSIEHLKIHPVLYVNTFFQVNEIRNMHQNTILYQQVSECFPTTERAVDEKLFDQLYTYTHLSINESRFYQNFLSEQAVTRIRPYLSFFESQFSEYVEHCNIDILVEILVCYFLAKVACPFEEEISTKIASYFDAKSGILKRNESDSLEDMEHAHALLLLYCAQPSVFFQTDAENLQSVV